MSESTLLKKFLVEYSAAGHRLFRFQSGLFWAGKSKRIDKPTTVTLNKGDVVIRRARPVKSGQPGISDLIGFTKIQITSDMIGRTFAVFTAIEVKTENVSTTKQQADFIRMVNQMGGIAVVAKNLNHIFESVNKFIGGNYESRH